MFQHSLIFFLSKSKNFKLLMKPNLLHYQHKQRHTNILYLPCDLLHHLLIVKTVGLRGFSWHDSSSQYDHFYYNNHNKKITYFCTSNFSQYNWLLAIMTRRVFSFPWCSSFCLSLLIFSYYFIISSNRFLAFEHA